MGMAGSRGRERMMFDGKLNLQPHQLPPFEKPLARWELDLERGVVLRTHFPDRKSEEGRSRPNTG